MLNGATPLNSDPHKSTTKATASDPNFGKSIPPPLPFSEFRFTTIGKEPSLLGRFSNIDRDPEGSDFSDQDQDELSAPPTSVPTPAAQMTRTRPSLLESLAGPQDDDMSVDEDMSISHQGPSSVARASLPSSSTQTVYDTAIDRSPSGSMRLLYPPALTPCPSERPLASLASRSTDRLHAGIAAPSNSAQSPPTRLHSIASRLSSSMFNLVPQNLSTIVEQAQALLAHREQAEMRAKRRHDKLQDALRLLQECVNESDRELDGFASSRSSADALQRAINSLGSSEERQTNEAKFNNDLGLIKQGVEELMAYVHDTEGKETEVEPKEAVTLVLSQKIQELQVSTRPKPQFSETFRHLVNLPAAVAAEADAARAVWASHVEPTTSTPPPRTKSAPTVIDQSAGPGPAPNADVRDGASTTSPKASLQRHTPQASPSLVDSQQREEQLRQELLSKQAIQSSNLASVLHLHPTSPIHERTPSATNNTSGKPLQQLPNVGSIPRPLSNARWVSQSLPHRSQSRMTSVPPIAHLGTESSPEPSESQSTPPPPSPPALRRPRIDRKVHLDLSQLVQPSPTVQASNLHFLTQKPVVLATPVKIESVPVKKELLEGAFIGDDTKPVKIEPVTPSSPIPSTAPATSPFTLANGPALPPRLAKKKPASRSNTAKPLSAQNADKRAVSVTSASSQQSTVATPASVPAPVPIPIPVPALASAPTSSSPTPTQAPYRPNRVNAAKAVPPASQPAISVPVPAPAPTPAAKPIALPPPAKAPTKNAPTNNTSSPKKRVAPSPKVNTTNLAPTSPMLPNKPLLHPQVQLQLPEAKTFATPITTPVVVPAASHPPAVPSVQASRPQSKPPVLITVPWVSPKVKPTPKVPAPPVSAKPPAAINTHTSPVDAPISAGPTRSSPATSDGAVSLGSAGVPASEPTNAAQKNVASSRPGASRSPQERSGAIAGRKRSREPEPDHALPPARRRVPDTAWEKDRGDRSESRLATFSRLPTPPPAPAPQRRGQPTSAATAGAPSLHSRIGGGSSNQPFVGRGGSYRHRRESDIYRPDYTDREWERQRERERGRERERERVVPERRTPEVYRQMDTDGSDPQYDNDRNIVFPTKASPPQIAPASPPPPAHGRRGGKGPGRGARGRRGGQPNQRPELLDRMTDRPRGPSGWNGTPLLDRLEDAPDSNH